MIASSGSNHDANRVTQVRLESGETLDAEIVVNVAGAWAPEVCRMVGMTIPVEPVYRPTFYFECEKKLDPLPLTKDPSGVGFRTEGAGFAAGLSRLDAAGGFRWDVGQDVHDIFDTEIVARAWRIGFRHSKA